MICSVRENKLGIAKFLLGVLILFNLYLLNSPLLSTTFCVNQTCIWLFRNKTWMCEVGSPHSRVQKCDFKNQKFVDEFDFPDFSIRH